MTRLLWVKRKSVAAVVICAVLAAASIAYWQMNQSAEAAMVYPHPGLVGWWRFDEASGTVAGDSSGYGNNGTIYGATWVDGKNSKALSFNGVSDYVEVPHSSSLSPSSAITLEAWVNFSRTNTMEVIFTKSTAGQDSWVDYALTHEVNNIFRAIFVVAGNIRVVDSLTHTDANVWHHVTATFDGQNLKMYVNGVLEGTANYVGALGTSTNPLRIGEQASCYFFNGTIDEVRVYNRALSTAEVQADFQKSPDFSSNLLAKVPKGTTQVIVTFSWQGTGSLNATIVSPSQTYTEDVIPVYQKTAYSTTGDGTASMLNIKRLSISVNALSSDQNWNITLTYDNVDAYQVTVEVQK